MAQVLDQWWDSVLLFFINHRSLSAMVAWAGVTVFDMLDLHMPAEWLVFTFFSFSVFVQTFGMSILLFIALTAMITVLNVTVFYTVPFAATSLFSTMVVCMLLVRGVHGLDGRGWALTAFMTLLRLRTPWCAILPGYLQAPIAAYCTSFGALWLTYHNSRRLVRLADPLCLVLGILPPTAPQIVVVDIAQDSALLTWKPQSIPSSTDSVHNGTVRDAQVARYEIELNGHVVGKCKAPEEQITIYGLAPATIYQIRLWAISNSRGRTPSMPVFVRTIDSEPTENKDLTAGDTQHQRQQRQKEPVVDTAALKAEVEQAQNTIDELEADISELQTKAEEEKNVLQKELAEWTDRRKVEDEAHAAEREKIRILEATKRRLENEKAQRDREMADALAKRQRALDRINEQERLAKERLSKAKEIEDTIERELSNFSQRQAELKKEIVAMKAETERTNQELAQLSKEEAKLSAMAKNKRKATKKTQQATTRHTRYPRAAATSPVNQLATSAVNSQAGTFKATKRQDTNKWPQPNVPIHSKSTDMVASNNAMKRHGRSSSVVHHNGHNNDLVSAATATTTNGYGRTPALTSSMEFTPLNRLNSGYPAITSSATASRRSAELIRGLGGFSDHNGLLPTVPASAALASAAMDSINRFSMTAGAPTVAPLPFWNTSRDSQPPSSFATTSSAMAAVLESPSALSTTTAEASALSILKDTDLAYPTPSRLDRRPQSQSQSRFRFASSTSSNGDLQPPLPPPPVFGGNNSIYSDRPVATTTSFSGHSPNLSLGSFDLRQHGHVHHSRSNTASTMLSDIGSLTGAGHMFGRASAASDENLPYPSAAASVADLSGLSLRRSKTPVEPPPLRLSSDLIGTPRGSLDLSDQQQEQSSDYKHNYSRPLIEPIGAPLRRKQAATNSNDSPAPNAAVVSSQVPVKKEISHPSSFGNSLYYSRSLWDMDNTGKKN